VRTRPTLLLLEWLDPGTLLNANLQLGTTLCQTAAARFAPVTSRNKLRAKTKTPFLPPRCCCTGATAVHRDGNGTL